jgi:hypothetical protein
MCEPATFVKTTHIPMYICVLIWVTEQDFSHKTQIPIAMTRGFCEYMYIIHYLYIHFGAFIAFVFSISTAYVHNCSQQYLGIMLAHCWENKFSDNLWIFGQFIYFRRNVADKVHAASHLNRRKSEVWHQDNKTKTVGHVEHGERPAGA